MAWWVDLTLWGVEIDPPGHAWWVPPQMCQNGTFATKVTYRSEGVQDDHGYGLEYAHDDAIMLKMAKKDQKPHFYLFQAIWISETTWAL